MSAKPLLRSILTTTSREALLALGVSLVAALAAAGAPQLAPPEQIDPAGPRPPRRHIAPDGGLQCSGKVVSLYEGVTDRPFIGGRSLDETTNVLSATSTTLVFRAFWRWLPTPEAPENIAPELTSFLASALKAAPEQIPEIVRQSGYHYANLRESLSAIRSRRPAIRFIGAIPAQRINYVEKNDLTGTIYGKTDTYRMALDPAKWGIPVSKEEAQSRAGVVDGYFPDLTNAEFQQLLLSWAGRQIDAGADGIWIDLLFAQAWGLKDMTGDVNHPAVRDSVRAAAGIVDAIHSYGQSKYGKHVDVGTWSEFVDLPYPPPNVDFVTAAPSSQEILARSLDVNRWVSLLDNTRAKLGPVPIIAFIDWGGSALAQMPIFSQSLSPADQRAMLRTMDGFFASKGVDFAYPVHGGDMGPAPARKSFGQFVTYDSLAPEFETYSTIRELAQAKCARK